MSTTLAPTTALSLTISQLLTTPPTPMTRAICSEARFAKKKCGNRLKPRHRFWMMPLADAVRELLLSALEWLAGLEEGLVDPDPGVFRNSPEGKRLSAYAAAAAQARVGRSEGGDALEEVVTFWNLGADGFQPYE